MNPAPLEDFAHSVVRMRSSLARVELAASRIARDSLTPATRELAAGITESVREIDEEIGTALGTFRAEPDAGVDVGDCAQVLAAMRDRMLPILRAHTIDWPAMDEDRDAFVHDRVGVERAALLMLRSGIALAGRGGRLALSLVHGRDSMGIGIRLATERNAPSSENENLLCDSLGGARAFAHRHRGSLELHDAARGAALVTLWLAPLEVE